MNTFQKHAMNYGAILGLVFILIFFIQYFLNLIESVPLMIAQYVLMISVIIWACIEFRNKFNNGTLAYGRALGLGTMISLYASLILAVVVVIFYKIIDPEALEAIRNYSAMKAEEEMYKQGLSDAEMEMAIEMTKKMISPFFMAIGSIIGLTFWGFIISLVTSAFVMKKKGNGFQDAMKEIETDKK